MLKLKKKEAFFSLVLEEIPKTFNFDLFFFWNIDLIIDDFMSLKEVNSNTLRLRLKRYFS